MKHTKETTIYLKPIKEPFEIDIPLAASMVTSGIIKIQMRSRLNYHGIERHKSRSDRRIQEESLKTQLIKTWVTDKFHTLSLAFHDDFVACR